ncbi:hypothetical protein LCGC14_2262470 [marine sediment metagenome]|uniref:DUF5675 domain-containing protein n=1 Tax=marine sediment metagenome TaxID=412755 RepID=A0A0F9FU95_9ZZZZ
MKTLELTRLSRSQLPMIPTEQFQDRTFGIMQVGYTPCNFIERAWIPLASPDEDKRLWSKQRVSCVPTGEYDLIQRKSPSKGLRWHLVNEDLGIYLEKSDCPDMTTSGLSDGSPLFTRFSCMFHPANWWYNLLGCIGSGLSLADFGLAPHDKGERGWGVTSSRATTAILESYLDESLTARLIIK